MIAAATSFLIIALLIYSYTLLQNFKSYRLDPVNVQFPIWKLCIFMLGGGLFTAGVAYMLLVMFSPKSFYLGCFMIACVVLLAFCIINWNIYSSAKKKASQNNG